jgi:hypothetical protein
MSQLTYNAQPDTGVPGDPAFANDQEVKIETYSNESQAINFGIMVSKFAGTDFSAVLPTLPTSQMVGITRRDLQRVEGLYPIKSAMAVMSFGQIWVQPETSVTADSGVYVRFNGKNQVTNVVFSADLVAGNTIDATVNGTVLSVPFNTTNAQTLTDFSVAIAAVAGIASAVSDGVHTIQVIGATHGVAFTITAASVTGGVSQPTIAVTTIQVGIADTARGRFRGDVDTDLQTSLPTAVLMKQCRYLTSVATYPSNSISLAIVDIISPLNS